MTEPAHSSGMDDAGKRDSGHSQPGAASPGAAGLRSTLPAACRAALRASAGGETVDRASVAGSSVAGSSAAEANAHAACPRCASVATFRERFAPLLAQPPTPPATLASRAFLDSVLERIVDDSARGTETWLRLAPRSADDAWPEDLLESPIAASVAATAPRSSMSAGSWDQMRRTILANVDAHKVLRVRRGWLLGLVATAAAAAVTASLLIADEAPTQPTIVFADLDSAPGVDFSVLRYGALR